MDLGYDGLACPVNEVQYHCYPRGKIQGYVVVSLYRTGLEQEEHGVRNSFSYLLLLFSGARR